MGQMLHLESCETKEHKAADAFKILSPAATHIFVSVFTDVQNAS
jgi:hypothetical protein